MAATSRHRARSGAAPLQTATRVLIGVALVNLAIVEVMFVTSQNGKNTTLTVAKFFALHATLLMMLQLVLVARLPWLDRRIGMDRLTSWHRWVGFTLLWTVVLHATFIVLGYARLDDASPFSTFGALAGVTASLLGMFAAATIVLIGVTSARAARRRLSYETWHALHLALYVAIGLAIVHQALEPSTFKATTLTKAYWWTLWALVVAAFVGGRIVLPLWRNAYHQFRVAAVVPESDDVVSVHVTGKHLDKLPARAGQFFIWRFPGHNNWWQANPFSLSKAPDGRSLRLTARGVGTTSRGLRELKVGTRVFAEGPYGAFTDLQRQADATLLIAGGVGITPIRALLEEAVGPVVVLYRVRTHADAVLLAELEELAAERQDTQIHVVAGRTGAGDPPVQPFDPQRLAALVPDIVDRDVYVCGPPAMTEAVLHSLRTLNVPRRQVHAERFSLAG
jgi:predicted ferric reductase